MLTIGFTSQHQAAVVGVAWLAELEFSTSTLRMTTAPVNIVHGGYTWQGIGQLGAVSAVGESADTDAGQITLSLSIVDSALLAAALADPATYRGRNARLYLALLDEQFVPVGSGPVLRWSGVMNRVSIKREPTQDGASQGTIEMQCMRRGMDRARNYQGLRLTDVQQQLRYPGDTGLRYVRQLIEKPALWLSKRFQQI